MSRIEESIEFRLLDKFTENLHKLEKEEVTEAYYMRRENLRRANLGDDVGKVLDDESTKIFDMEEMSKSIDDFEGKGISYHTFESIGKATLFPVSHWKRMYPTYAPGSFGDRIGEKGTPGIQVKEEGLKLTYNLSKLTLPHER